MAERDWIARYFAPAAASDGAAGLKDDVCVLTCDASRALVATVDALVEGVHFLTSDPISSVARKLVRVNVSDILAKGAAPSEALLTLGWPEGRSEGELALFADALAEELEAWGARLVGGDTTASPGGLFLSLALTGMCGARGPIRRQGARDGDELWVSGDIGAACLGFRALQAGDGANPFVDAYQELRLPPESIAGLVRDHAAASMDVSDGLLGDARQLAEASGLAVHIDLDRVPFAGGEPDLKEMLQLATWGDDYQVLMAAPPTSASLISQEASESGIKITRIGSFQSGHGLTVMSGGTLVNLPETLGFEHG
ncbi:MAG: thiamine-phosphate kinase [Hyphomonas sp.]|uniref:thiamine-phosphate kinase n=1 Tax=Hyphomonas sp. TaxID=87 RepID=UPI003526DEAD